MFASLPVAYATLLFRPHRYAGALRADWRLIDRCPDARLDPPRRRRSQALPRTKPRGAHLFNGERRVARERVIARAKGRGALKPALRAPGASAQSRSVPHRITKGPTQPARKATIRRRRAMQPDPFAGRLSLQDA